MGSKSQQTPQISVPNYELDVHYGWSLGPVDAVRTIKIRDKVAWRGLVRSNAEITINKQSLFGGQKKSGGVLGRVRFLLGADDQLMPADLAAKYGRTPATMPGFRGIFSLFFHGVPGQTGFRWGANDPRLPEVEVEASRYPVGLGFQHSKISRGPRGKISVIFSVDASGSMNGTREAIVKAAMVDALETIRAEVAYGADIDVRVAFWNESLSGKGYTSATVANMDTLISFVSSFNIPSIGGTDFSVAATDAVNWFNSTSTDADITARSWVFLTDGEPNAGTSNSAASIAADLLDQSSGVFNSNAGTQVDAFAVNIDLTNTVETAKLDNTSIDGVPIVSSSDQSGFDEVIDRALYPIRIPFDTNPAHAIWEVETEGEGAPGPLLMDKQSFLDTAAKLFEEGLGLSFVNTSPTSVENYINEILGHIQGTYFLHPLTGLMTLALLRDDYDVENLTEVNPSNAQLLSYSTRSLDETVNSIKVTWTNPNNEEEANTPAVQDLGNIEAQGRVASDGRNFYGVRTLELAQTLAYRELRVVSQPLATMEIALDRSFWSVVPGKTLKLNWPDQNVSAMPIRVTEINYGSPKNRKIVITATEDAFGKDDVEFDFGSGGLHEDVTEEPREADYLEAFTLPYYFTLSEIVDPSSTEAPYVYSGFLVGQGGTDTADYLLLGDATDSLGNLYYQELTTNTVLARGTIDGLLAAEATSASVTVAAWTQGATPVVGSFVVIGTGDEASQELAVVSAYDSETGEYTLVRGVLDTVPRRWPNQTPIWALTSNSVFVDQIPRPADIEMDWKVLPTTSQGTLDEASASLLSKTPIERPYYPTRPANVQINGTAFGSVDISGGGTATVTYATRNRLTEDSQIMLWTDTDVTPEDGQTTTVTVMAADRTVLATHDAVTSPFAIPGASFGSEPAAIVRVTSKRDGYESLQGHETVVLLDNVLLVDDLLVTVDGKALVI